MRSYAGNIAGIATTDFEIGLVAVERFRDRRRFVVVAGAVGSTSRPSAGMVLRLPEVEDIRVVGFGEIVRCTNAVCPVRAITFGNPYYPCPGRLIAAVTEAQAAPDLDENRLLRDRQLFSRFGCLK